MGKKVFIIDTKTCNGCYSCQIGCKDEHVANDWSPIAKPQPEIGQFWLKLEERVRGTVPKVKVAYRPHLCMHCDNPTCMEACPIPGAIYKRDDALVIIDPVKCTGCRNCLEACPYDAIYFNEDLNIAQKCTGCAHLIDAGWKETRCTDNCPTVCMRILDEDSEEAKEFIAGAEFYKPEIADKMKPRVYYKGLPKKFIAGTVFAPATTGWVFAGTPAGLFVSKDTGETWQPAHLVLQFTYNTRREIGGAAYVDAYWRGRYYGFIDETAATDPRKE